MKEELKKNLLIINSKDRKKGDSNNFTYNLGETSIDIEGVALKSAVIPHTYTNVNKTNNVLKYSQGTEIVLADPYEGALVVNGIVDSYFTTGGPIYTQDQFINAINTSIGLGTIIELSYNTVASRYEIRTKTTVAPGLQIIQPTYNPTYRNLWVYLGFTSPTTLGNTIGSITQAPNPPLSPFDVEPVEYFEETIAEGQYTLTELMPLVAAAISLNIPGSINVQLLSDGLVQVGGALETWRFEDCEIATMLGYVPREMTYSAIQIAQGVPNMYG